MENYLNAYIPAAGGQARTSKISWGGLERRQYVDTGTITNMVDISTDEYPYLTPSKEKLKYNTKSYYGDLRGIFGYEDKLLVIYGYDGDLYFDFYSDAVSSYKQKLCVLNSDDTDMRSVVLFNVAVNTDDEDDFSVSEITGVEYIKRLLIFPDKKVIDAKTLEIYDLEGCPDIKYATVYNARLFGVDDGKIYASGFNDYANWTLDTIDSYDESNAWVSTSQANVKASGNFVGITTFQNHVICFKEDYMHEIYNNKNPFRVQDIYAEGTIDQRSIQDVGGMLIFADKDFIKAYTGSQPRILSYELNIKNITKAVSGNDGRKYYLYCVCDDALKGTTKRPHLFVYDTLTQLWSEESFFCDDEGYFEIKGFAKTSDGFFAVGTTSDDGYIYRLDNKAYSDSWEFETDIMTNGTVDIKHLQKIQLYAEMGADSSLKIYMLYDGIYNGDELSDEINGDGKTENTAKARLVAKCYNDNSIIYKKYIRFIIPKSAHGGFKLKFKGNGYVKLYQMELILSGGGQKTHTS